VYGKDDGDTDVCVYIGRHVQGGDGAVLISMLRC